MSDNPKPLRGLLSPAKLNLSLWITGRRKDGYHEILSLFYKIPLYDEVFVESSDKLEVIFENENIDAKDNTIYKTVKLMEELTGKKFHLKIRVIKHIPSGSGLGGASSNAAVILKYLNESFSLSFSKDELAHISKSISADAPFFIYESKLAIVRGIGEIVEPINLKFPFGIVMLVPNIKSQTRRMYQLIDQKGITDNYQKAERKLKSILKAIENEDYDYINENLYNTFEKVFFNEFPQALKFREKLSVWGNVHLSGSGSSMFCITKEDIKLLKLL